MGTTKLTRQIITIAQNLFAGKNWMTTTQIKDFFGSELKENRNIEYHFSKETKKEYFQRLLEYFDLNSQIHLLLRLCESPPEENNNNYPSLEERKKLKNLINEFQQDNQIGEGVNSKIERIIFANKGKKISVQYQDALSWTNPTIERNDRDYLIYEHPIKENVLTWQEVLDWWRTYRLSTNLGSKDELPEDLYEYLSNSLFEDSPPANRFFKNYFKCFREELGENLPALFPEVFIRYETFSKQYRQKLGMSDDLGTQRFDFVLFFSSRTRIIIEIDGVHHYSSNGNADSEKYAQMVCGDRHLKLAGYEIYRFGATEITTNTAENVVKDFFNRLFKKHKIT